MAPKARAPQLKLLLGNPGKRKVNRKAPRGDRGVPRRPGWLGRVAKIKFRKLARPLARLGLLTSLDGDLLAAYCQSYAEWRQATEALEREGRTYRDKAGRLRGHPAFGQQQAALKLMRVLGADLGLSPASRSRLPAAPGGEGDPLSEFLPCPYGRWCPPAEVPRGHTSRQVKARLAASPDWLRRVGPERARAG